jgi:hypothetical protein
MPGNPIPGLIMPGPFTPARITDDLAAILRWSKGVSPRTLFAGTPLVGSGPPAPPSDSYLIGWDNPSIPVVAGIGTATFIKPFPNGVLWIGLQRIHGAVSVDDWSVSSPSLSGFTFNSSAGGTGTLQISYQVVGW